MESFQDYFVYIVLLLTIWNAVDNLIEGVLEVFMQYSFKRLLLSLVFSTAIVGLFLWCLPQLTIK